MRAPLATTSEVQWRGHQTSASKFHCESPILHVCCRRVRDAARLLRAARLIGLKYGGIQAINTQRARVMLELTGNMRIAVPLMLGRGVAGANGEGRPGRVVLVDEGELDVLGVYATRRLIEARECFMRLVAHL
mmetsp:Transcript_17282/g.49069  ORF Transcript_17282/g.49069 Transcript_17282/m.49069 type:complete len:133 (+) Transcript_17282:304-702(+)